MFNKDSLSKFEQEETPFYYYDLKVLKNTLDALTKESKKHNYHVHYALKANSNNEILDLIESYGLGADCVSGNEVLKALERGFSNDKIAFAGVGKTDKEINIALDNDIFCLNCESIPEIEVINELAEKKNKVAQIALRINPNVDANTHHYITTGLEENKFGINMWEMEKVLEVVKNAKHIKLIGLHFHIGSQITDLNVFRGLCVRVNEIQQKFLDKKILVDHINVGGGLGVNYQNPDENLIPDFESFFSLFQDHLDLKTGQELHFELGRSVVAQCGALISRVLYVKEGINTNFAIIDAGMTELIRPALYQSYHKVENLSTDSKNQERYDVVGPICESSDSFAKSLMLPSTKRGDLMAIRTTGAYGDVMASQYNLREIANKIFA